MKTTSNAQKMEQKNEIPMLTVVTPEKEAVKTEEGKETVNVMEVIQKVNDEYINGKRVLPSERERRETAPPAKTKAVKPQLTIEDIKRKNEVLKRLTDKYDRLQDKLRRVENFKLSSDRETATIVVTDSNGEEFMSNSLKTLVQLIAFWHDEFKQAIAEVEKEIRENA